MNALQQPAKFDAFVHEFTPSASTKLSPCSTQLKSIPSQPDPIGDCCSCPSILTCPSILIRRSTFPRFFPKNLTWCGARQHRAKIVICRNGETDMTTENNNRPTRRWLLQTSG